MSRCAAATISLPPLRTTCMMRRAGTVSLNRSRSSLRRHASFRPTVQPDVSVLQDPSSITVDITEGGCPKLSNRVGYRDYGLRLPQTAAYIVPDADLGSAPTDFDLSRCKKELADLQTPWKHYDSDVADKRSAWLDAEFSSNIAGEAGAVFIYKGARAALRRRGHTDESSPELLGFVRDHQAAEEAHLAIFEQLLPPRKRTKLLPVWRAAGFSLGFGPALISPRLLYLTVQAVETFVEGHYMQQINELHYQHQHGEVPSGELVKLLRCCCADEVHHKEDAAKRAGGPPGAIERAWMAVVKVGSAVAAGVARRV